MAHSVSHATVQMELTCPSPSGGLEANVKVGKTLTNVPHEGDGMTLTDTTSRKSLELPLYAQPRPWLFLALAPGVIGSILILTPWAVMGLLLIVPGVCGFLGLAGMTMAWLGLVNPEIIHRRRDLITGCLIGSLPAIVFGVSILAAKVPAYYTHALDWERGAGWASAGFGLLTLFLLANLIPRRSPPVSDSQAKHGRLLACLGGVVAVIGAVVPVGYVLALSCYGDQIRAAQVGQAHQQVFAALNAVDDYRHSHRMTLPIDNHAVGLSDLAHSDARYVQSVRVDHGTVTLTYKENRLATLFGVGAADVVLTLTPADPLQTQVIQTANGAWACKVAGYREEGDIPLLLGGYCDNGNGPRWLIH
jgi:hypothetical protein